MTGDGHEGAVLHRPPEDAPGAGAMYPRVERLEHADDDGDVLLATFEHYASADEDDGPYFRIYRSTDGGETWSSLSTLAEGGRALPRAGETPVWEPEIDLDTDGNLVCYFADERHREDGYNQLVGHRVSRDGGRTWGREVFDVAIPGGEERPGMPVVTRLSDGHQLTNGPYVTWTPAGGEDGTLLVSGKTLRDSAGEQAPGSGRTLLATTDFENFETWVAVSAPLHFEDETDTSEKAVAWTTPLLPSRDGTRLLEMTSTYVDDGRCEIRYAVDKLDRNCGDLDFDSQ